MDSLGKSLQRSKKVLGQLGRGRFQNIQEKQRMEALQAEECQQHAQRDGNNGGGLKSIWETNDLDTFLSIADAREEGYFAERDVRVVVGGKAHVVRDDKVVPHKDDTDRDWLKLSELLTVPRRPSWGYNASAEAVQDAERAAFLDWRRSLAKIEEEHKVLLTPYEKNLEVWRQLWRVVERADLVMTIVDARNPLVFRCKDFETYVKSTKNAAGNAKESILLLNKSDLLSENQRRAWAHYFQSIGITFFFFSAKPLEEPSAAATTATNTGREDDDEEEEEEEVADGDAVVEKITRKKKEKSRHKKKSLRAPVEVANAYQLAEQRRLLSEQAKLPRGPKEPKPRTEEEKRRDERAAASAAVVEPWTVLTPSDLLDQLALRRAACGIVDDNTPLMAGFVGFPNVGKSSTINAIMGCKKVVVSATPGKTKHFQTLVIPEERRIALCDCPGLVFPSFATNREQMVCDGVLPVDTVTDALEATAVVCRRLPRVLLEMKLNVSLSQEDDLDDSHSLAERLLNAMARRRGYMASHDRPNRARAGKELLKAYVDGRFVYAEPPPDFNPAPEVVAIEQFLHTADAPAVTSREDGEDQDEWDSVDDEAWAELDEAADERALSEGDWSNESSADGEVLVPVFYARPHGHRAHFTRHEFFNLEGNAERMVDRRTERARKRRTNHQLEPDTATFINREGEVELRIDDDDGVLELVTAQAMDGEVTIAHGTGRTKMVSKRKQRREMKKVGGHGPANPTKRCIGVQDY